MLRRRAIMVNENIKTKNALEEFYQENEYTDIFPVKIPKYQKVIKRCYTQEELQILVNGFV